MGVPLIYISKTDLVISDQTDFLNNMNIKNQHDIANPLLFYYCLSNRDSDVYNLFKLNT